MSKYGNVENENFEKSEGFAGKRRSEHEINIGTRREKGNAGFCGNCLIKVPLPNFSEIRTIVLNSKPAESVQIHTYLRI